MGETIDRVAESAKRIRDSWTTAGRDPARLRVLAPLEPIRDGGRVNLRQTLGGAIAQAAAGVTDVQLGFALRRPEALDDFFGELEEAWAAVGRAR